MFRNALRSTTALRADERGNVAMIGALAVIPILSVAGLALDLQLTTTRKNEVQAIIDSAVLSGSKMKQAGASEAEIRAHITEYMNTFIALRDGTFDCADPVIDSEDGTQDINATIRCRQGTTLSQVFGKAYMDFDVGSGTTYGIGKVEVAFVFDVSGSMSSNNRMTNLKVAAETAVETLLATLTENSEADDVRIAMVSYDNRVNAGDFFGDVTDPSATRTYTATNSTTTSVQTTCRRYRNNGTCREWNYEDVTTYSPVSITVPACVEERIGNEAFTDAEPGPGAYLEVTEPWFRDSDNSWRNVTSCNDDRPVPLTSDEDDLKDFINGLQPGSGTAGHLGTQWGRYLLSPEWSSVWPSASTPLAYDAPDLKKAMILMTDGEFNTAFNTSLGNSATQAREHCDEAKAQGIVIYTVAFQAPQAGKDLLAYCATDSSKAFTPEGAADLTEAYQTIASEISDLRITY